MNRPDTNALYNCCAGGIAPDWQDFTHLELAGCRDAAPDMRAAGDTWLAPDETHIDGLQPVALSEFFTVYGRRHDGTADAITDITDAPGALSVAATLSRLSGLPCTISTTLENDERVAP